MPAAKPTYVIEESGHFVPDGELDLIRIPPGSVEAYHFELMLGQRFRFAIAASSIITVRLADDRGDSEDSVMHYPAFERVDSPPLHVSGAQSRQLHRRADKSRIVAGGRRCILPDPTSSAPGRRCSRAPIPEGEGRSCVGRDAGMESASRPTRSTLSHP